MSRSLPRRALVTGGAGFIGSNLTAALLRAGVEVSVFDNLSRAGSRRNLLWLHSLPESRRLRVLIGDVRRPDMLAEACQDQQEIYHFAAQVAVTSSLLDPRLDFEINLAGTFNLLEAARRQAPGAFVLFTSTNKVYGALDEPPSGPGVDEGQPLDLHSPYGCSKGAADQYVRDYGRVYGLRSAVLRMSCIYGPRQNGTEDQGWVAHFMFAALRSEPVWIYGDGEQVRDLLYVDDLIAAMDALRTCPQAAGQVFNVGGGRSQTRSVRQVLADIEALTGRRIEKRQGPWRVGDQRAYISNTSKLQQMTGWKPRTGVETGFNELYRWARTLCQEEQESAREPSPARAQGKANGGLAPGKPAWAEERVA